MTHYLNDLAEVPPSRELFEYFEDNMIFQIVFCEFYT